MSDSLSQSYATCAKAARRAASNFYLSFYFLPRQKRLAMCALYAFLRKTDDLGDSEDSENQRRQALVDWRDELTSALGGSCSDPLLPALVDTVHRYEIPTQYLFDVMDGVEMDLRPTRFETFVDLEKYCYHVASVVGLSCIHIWGFQGQEAMEPAIQCGTAFQLTNILRDLKEDAQRGRVYLPQEDLDRFGYSTDNLVAGITDERFAKLMQFQIDRAYRLYDQAAELESFLHSDGRRVFAAMTATYRGLLQEIERHSAEVFSRRLRLSRWNKLGIATRSLLNRPTRKSPKPTENSPEKSPMRSS